MTDYLAIARRVLATWPESKVPEPPAKRQVLTTTLDTVEQAAGEARLCDLPEGATKLRAFPHCPRCSSFYLYRKNNVGNYECQTCEMRDITADVARRPHRA
jgi:hypothetical protein